ncbi:MAG: sulfatase-like hydrolase/transferase [Rubripirellula sp.]
MKSTSLSLASLLSVFVALFAIEDRAALAQIEQASERPPNVILIMADDVSWECFGCYGAEDYLTPNIDALAADGIRFQHCYSTPICTPSRVKIMTGKYSFRNYTHFGYLSPKEKTFGHLLQAAGYKTAIAGKWQLNGLYNGAEGNQDNTRPNKAGFDEYCLWQVTTGKGGEGGERFWSPPLEHNGKFVTKEQNENKYGPDIMSDFVCDFIQRNRDQPFFVYYPTVLVHNPFVPTPDSIGDAPRTHETNKAPKDKAARKANFVAMVNYLDKIVGKIVKTVDEAGQLENTIIMFTADNGTNVSITSGWNGQQIQGGKGGTTDMGTHVPMVASWKGRTPAGLVIEDLVDFTDFYPTMAAAAGIELGESDPVDGVSFLPRLTGKKASPRAWVFNHYQPYWGKFLGKQSARDQDFKLYRDGRFYNVPEDLTEVNVLKASDDDGATKNRRAKLSQVLKSAPPAPPEKGGKDATVRPVHPEWAKLLDPND